MQRSYSVKEFFYDKSFRDYDQNNNYILTYTKPIAPTLNNPDRITLENQLYILAYKPEIQSQIPLADVIGVFDAVKDDVGVYGSHRFINTTLANILEDRLGKDGLYKFAPFGDMLYNNNDEVVQYFLRGLYLRYK